MYNESNQAWRKGTSGMKTGLVLEGGALRTIFSSGVCDAMLEAGLTCDYLVGVSAGVTYGTSFISRQPRYNLEVVTTYAGDRRYMGFHNLLARKNQSYFGLKFAYETIPRELVPFDYDTFEKFPGVVEAVVTNMNTGLAEYLHALQVINNLYVNLFVASENNHSWSFSSTINDFADTVVNSLSSFNFIQCHNLVLLLFSTC